MTGIEKNTTQSKFTALKNFGGGVMDGGGAVFCPAPTPTLL